MSGRRYKTGVNREQEELFPARLGDYVGEENVVRAIDLYVEGLDLGELGFTRTGPVGSDRGQPPYPPGALLKLYLYGYLNRIRGSRPMERECRRNVEVMWLLDKLQPSYKTIANFRKDNGKALRATHRQFIVLCKELSLLSSSRVAVDGSFFNGDVSAKSFKVRGRLEKQLKELDGLIDRWLGELDRYDEQTSEEEGSSDVQGMREKLAHLRERQEKVKADLAELERLGQTQYSTVDEDARLLSKRGKKVSGYNVQIVTDAQNKLIVSDEVVQDGNDLQQLHPMSLQAREVLGVETLEVLADSGYHSSAQIVACAQEKEKPIIPFVPEPDRAKSKRDKGRLEPRAFHYDTEQDHYRCPAGLTLVPSGEPREQAGRRMQRYVSREKGCRECPLRARCLSPKGRIRELWRDENEPLLEELRQRMAEHPGAMRERSAMVEHPFGTLKRRAGWDHFLVRGLEKVRGEWSLMALAYNFTRVLNLIGMDALMAYLAQRASFTSFIPPIAGQVKTLRALWAAWIGWLVFFTVVSSVRRSVTARW